MSTVKYQDPITGEWLYTGAPMEVKGMTMDLLWTNPNPSAEFPPQTVAVNYKPYDLIVIATRVAKDVGYGPVFCSKPGNNFSMIGSWHQNYLRNVNFVESGLEIKNGTTFPTYANGGATNTDNTWLIPYQIYGIKNTPVTYPEGGGTTESIEHPGCFYRMVNGVQEWLNPPMELDVEYKTTERYMGKPVYKKLVDFGTLPNATTKDVPHGVVNAESMFIDLGETRITNGNAYTNFSPLATTSISAIQLTPNGSQNVVRIATTFDLTAWYGYVCVKYTKTTD